MELRHHETPAPPLRRIGAFAIDYVVIAAYATALTAASFAARAALGAGQGPPPSGALEKLVGHALAFVTLTAPVVLYFAISESSRRQATLGKRVVGMRVVSRSGRRLKFRRSLLRSAVKFAPWELAHVAIWHSPGRPFVDEPSLLAWIVHGAALGLATWFTLSLFTHSRRTPYDRLAKCRVVREARGVVRRRVTAEAAPEVVDVDGE